MENDGTKADITTPKFATYKQVAEEFVKDAPFTDWASAIEGINKFAAHLDSFKTLSSEFQILALQETLKVYVEFYNLMKEKCPADVFEECLGIFRDKHKHR